MRDAGEDKINWRPAHCWFVAAVVSFVSVTVRSRRQGPEIISAGDGAGSKKRWLGQAGTRELVSYGKLEEAKDRGTAREL
jgi:hypothetical protein